MQQLPEISDDDVKPQPIHASTDESLNSVQELPDINADDIWTKFSN